MFALSEIQSKIGEHMRFQISNWLMMFKVSVLLRQGIAEIDGGFDAYRKEVLEELGEEVFNPSVIANKAIEQ